MAPSAGPAGGGNIKVVVRVRPFNSRGSLFYNTGRRAAAGESKTDVAGWN